MSYIKGAMQTILRKLLRLEKRNRDEYRTQMKKTRVYITMKTREERKKVNIT